MSRDRLFELYRQFTERNTYLKEKAYIVLLSALNQYEENGKEIQNVYDKMYFTLMIFVEIYKKEKPRMSKYKIEVRYRKGDDKRVVFFTYEGGWNDVYLEKYIGLYIDEKDFGYESVSILTTSQYNRMKILSTQTNLNEWIAKYHV